MPSKAARPKARNSGSARPWTPSRPATAGNGTHVAFTAPTHAAVHAFYEAALANGGQDDGPPGPRPAYGPDFYGCFVRDPDGAQDRGGVPDIKLLLQECTISFSNL